MTAATTIKVFGTYAIVAGTTLLFVPNLLLSAFGFPPTQEIWIRMLGAVAAVLGGYYVTLGVANARVFFVASLYGRACFFLACLGLVVLAGAPLPLLVFGVVDLAGAAWTWAALRGETRPPAA